MIPFTQLPFLARFSRCLIKTKVAVMSGFRVHPVPAVLIWESNARCNARCPYCDFRNNGPEEKDVLSEQEAKDLIDQASALGVGCFSITGGGEPLLREDIEVIIRYAKKKGMAVAVTTNGLLINEKSIKYLLEANIITVSLDSLDEEVNSVRRGSKEHLRKSLAGIELLAAKNRNNYICVQSVVDEENWREMNALNDRFYSLGVDTLFQPRYHHTFTIPKEEWIERVGKLRYRCTLTRKLLREFMTKFTQIADGTWRGSCLAGSVALVVSASGDILVCHLRRENAYNIKQTSLLAAWQDMRPIRRILLQPERDCICGDTAIVPYSMLLTS
jgi:MoaA/NifB/PqqE/SkfB family radical SAM enzyme